MVSVSFMVWANWAPSLGDTCREAHMPTPVVISAIFPPQSRVCQSMTLARAKQPPSRSRRRGQSRLELAAVAIRLFEEKGFEATTVEEIAEEAGYSPRTFFRQFSRKEDVLFFDLPDMARPLRRLL